MMREASSLTILFADVCQSTRLFERLGDTAGRRLVSEILDLLGDVANDHEGRVVKTIGDEIMATFPGAEPGARAARDMQALVEERSWPEGTAVHVRIGLHHGPVIQEGGDVFGDAVNVASRMAEVAQARQIITTGETAARLGPDTPLTTRGLGRLNVKGKAERMELREVVWEEDVALTSTAGSTVLRALRTIGIPDLLLFCGEERTEVGADTPFALGRGPDNDMVIANSRVSRRHATIECRNEKYFFVDHSTNGSWIRAGTRSELFVHREEVHLDGEGAFCLGASLESGDVPRIRFLCSRE